MKDRNYLTRFSTVPGRSKFVVPKGITQAEVKIGGFPIAYMEFALDGYESDAMDYLLKPTHLIVLRAVQKVQQGPAACCFCSAKFSR